MTQSQITKFLPYDDPSENVLFNFTHGRLLFDHDAWADALPAGGSAGAIEVFNSYTQPLPGQSDFSLDVGMTLEGEFHKVGGKWTGTVTGVSFSLDGTTMVEVEVNSGVDISSLINVQGSSQLWLSLVSTGVVGTLTDDDDYMLGSNGRDVLYGGDGDDWITGASGRDRIFGGDGKDYLDGHIGNDVLIGGRGNDVLSGRNGSDVARGGAGRDIFDSDTFGNNVWTGGKGADRFQPGAWRGDNEVSTKVTDFNLAEGDMLDLSTDQILLFKRAEEVRYIGDDAFSIERGVYQIRMENGFVSIDVNGDGVADRGLYLEGLDSIDAGNTDWIYLPDGYDLG
ncbi:MAG: calcium-binding protein [Pseudodonghicola sp.]